MRGAFWSKEIEAARAEGRVGMVRYDNTLPVYAAVDLGWADTMVVVFKQMAGTEDRYIDCRAFELTSIPDMLASWRHGEDKLPFPVDHIVLPHDAKVHELGSGKTRQEVFTSMGYDTSICPDVGLLEGIEQTRQALRHAWFDAERCKVLLEAMAHFRSEYDEVRRVHRMTPLHDSTSHYAAAVRYGTIGRPAALGGYKPNSRGYRRLGRVPRGSNDASLKPSSARSSRPWRRMSFRKPPATMTARWRHGARLLRRRPPGLAALPRRSLR